MSFITPARFLFNAGKTPKEWNKKVLSDDHFSVVQYSANSTDVFPNVDIKGGVSITIYNKNMIYGSIGTFSPFNELSSILYKVKVSKPLFISEMINQCNKFELNKLYEKYPEYRKIIGSAGRERRLTTKIFEQLDCFTDTATSINKLEIKGLIKNTRVSKFIDPELIEKDPGILKYKVIVPKSNGSGSLGEVLSTPMIGQPMIGQPMIGHTQSFINFGYFDEEKEAKACLKYIKTKFARCLLGTLKVTQHNPKSTWENVPLQDFSEAADIDWSLSVHEIDLQLYKKYGLSDDEIKFIEEKIQNMD